MTAAPSMPMKTHIMMIMQFMTCSNRPPMLAASAPISPAATALLYTLPQKSAVKMPALNMKMAKIRKMPREATFATMTIAFRNEALSTPRMTRKVSAHMNSEATITHGKVLPGRKVGKK